MNVVRLWIADEEPPRGKAFDASPDALPDQTHDGAETKRPFWWSKKPKEPIDSERARYQALGRAIVGGGLIVIMVVGAWLFTVLASWGSR